MNRARQERAFDEIVTRMRTILFKKGDDYSDGEDRLSCFKKGGSLAGKTAENQCLSLLTNKVVRLAELLNSPTEPQNETINDTLDDLGNFAILCQMIRMDSAAGRARANDKCGEHYSRQDSLAAVLASYPPPSTVSVSKVIVGDFAAKKPATNPDPRFTAEPVVRSPYQQKIDKVLETAAEVLKEYNAGKPAA
jgi:hypothetical protein